MAAWFEAGLLDAGHRVTFSESYVEPSAINVFWECFSWRAARDIAALGVTYGIVATEIPDGSGFNWRREQPWTARWEAFEAVARRAAFIWTMVESTIDFYARYCPCAYLPLGFSQRLEPKHAVVEPPIDYAFFGLRTPYREAIVAELRSAGVAVEWPERFLSGAEVLALVEHSKVGLSFKQSDDWPIPSPTRLGRLMMARRVVAAEHVAVPTQQGEIAGICPADRPFTDYALSLLDGWRTRADDVFCRYRAEMPMRAIVENVLEATISPGCASLEKSRDAERVAGIRPSIALRQEPDAAQLLAVVNGYNVVFYANRFIALPHTEGAIDFSAFDPDGFAHQSTDRADLERMVAQMPKVLGAESTN